MANPFDQFTAPGSNPFDQFDPMAKKPAADGQAVSGFKRSFQEVPGTLAGVGAFAADVVGADGARDSMLAYAKRKSDEVGAAHAGDAQSLTDAWDGKTSWGDFLANAAGYVAGQAIQSILTGGAGAIGARMLANNGIKQIGVKVAAEQIAAGATEEMAKAAAVKAMATAGEKAAVRGGIAGATAQNLNMELGSIYPEAVEQAGGADKLDNGDRFRVLAASALAAGVDTAGEALTAFKWLKGSTAGGSGILGRAAREVPAGMAREAGTEAIQTGIEQWGAAKPLDVREIVDSAGIGAVGGGLAGAGASVRAREKPAEQPKPDAVDVLGAGSVDDAIEAAKEAVSAPAAPAVKPRQANASAAAELALLDPADRAEALSLMQVAERMDVSGNVRRYAQNRLDELLAPVRQIPTPDVTEVLDAPLPTGEATELNPDELSARLGRPSFTQRRMLERGIPVPEATELIPTGDVVETPDAIPAGEVTEYEPPAGMVPRRNTDGQPLDLSQSRAVAGYVERMRGINTPAARAFVQDYRAGRITDDDVMGLIVPTRRAEPTADERIAAAAAQAPKVEVRPGDILTADGMPYGRKTAANVRAVKEGLTPASVIEIPGAGWVVRPKEARNVNQPDVSGVAGQPVADGAGRPDAAVGGELAAGRVASDATGQQPGTATAVAPGSAGNAPAGAGNAPNTALTGAAPELVKVRTVFGTNAYVRSSDLAGDDNGLVRMFTADGKNNGRIARGNLDQTGEKRAAAAKEDADNPMFNVITRKGGGTFADQASAARELSMRGMGETHEVVPASEISPSATGYAIRKKPEGAGPTFTEGQRVQLAGQSYTVTTVNGSAVRLQGADGSTKMVALNSKTFGQIQPEAATEPVESTPFPPADAAEIDAARAAWSESRSEANRQRLQRALGKEAPLPPVATGMFDPEAFDRERNTRIKASREAGNTHLDQVPAYVETMRGKDVYGVHDTKVRGRILTVDNNGNVYVEWLDKYSQDKEGATPMKMGKRQVMQSSLGPRDLKDYVAGKPQEPNEAARPQAQAAAGESAAPAAAPAPAAPAVVPGAGGATDEAGRLKALQVKWKAEPDRIPRPGLKVEQKDSSVLGIPGSAWFLVDEEGRQVSPGFSTKKKADEATAQATQENPEKQRLQDEIIAIANRIGAAKEKAPAPAPEAERTPKAQAVKEALADRKLPKRTEARGMAKHPRTVMGSRILAIVSSSGGLDLSLLSEFSERVPTGRTDKNGMPTYQWRNPLIPGVGRLFRRGGTSDYSQLGELMEEAGYLPPGSSAADYKEAGENAKQIIKDALGRSEAQTQDEIIAEAQARRDALAQESGPDEYADLDPETAAEVEAERQAIMAANDIDADRLGATADDDIPFDGPGLSGAAGMRASGMFSEQEIADAEQQERQALQQSRTGGQARQDGPQGARPAAEAGSPAARGAGEEEGLKGPPVAEGERIRFTSKEGATIDGMAVQVLDTSGGNYRIKIRTDEPAPQGGGNISRTVYSQDGTFAPLDEPLLTAQTADDLKAKTEREAAGAAAERAKKAADQERLRRDAEARDIRARADQTVDDFQLGQSADEQMGGMGDLFAQPAAAPDPRAMGLQAGRDGKPRMPPEEMGNFDRQAWRAGWDQSKQTKGPTPQLPTPQQMASFIGIAADSIGKLRGMDVDRVIRETPAIYRVAVAGHIRDKRPDLAQDVADSLADMGATPAGPQPITPAEAANMQRGDIVRDGSGTEFYAWAARFGRLDVMPLKDGKPVVNNASAIRFALDDTTREANPEYRTDPLYLVRSAEAPAAPAEQAAAILNAAAEPPKGKERLDVLKDVKAGAITPEEVAAAYPAATTGTESLNKRHAIAKKQVLTPGGALKADATNSRADSAVWYYQGDMDALRFTASVKVDGKADPRADDAKRMLVQIKAAQDAGWRRANYRAGSLGTVWVFQRGDEFLTRAGMENAAAVEVQRPVLPEDGPGYDKMVARQRVLARAFNDWLLTLPEDQQYNRGVVSRKLGETPVGQWAGIGDDPKMGLTLRYFPGPDEKQGMAVAWSIQTQSRPDWPALRDYIAELAAEAPVDDAPAVAPTAAEAPAVAAQPANAFDAYKAVMRALDAGTATVDDYRAGYARVKDADATKAELGKMTKDELIRTFGIMRDGKKDELVSMAYEDMLRSFALGKTYGPTSYMMVSGGYADYKAKTAKALDELVAGQTADDLAAYAAEEKRASEERASKRAALVESVKNPKTLSDFQNFIRFQGQEGKSFKEARMMLTPERRAAYDELAAESSRSSRKVKQDAERTTVRAAGQTTAGEIIATKHTRDGHDLWVVKLADRVSKDDYITLLASAKRLGGNYSSFRGNGAVPGFQFRSPDAAQAFLKLAGGDTAQATEVAQERRNAFEDDRSQSAAERLTEMADRLEERADESLGRDRKANTDRRARFAAAAEAAASADKAMAKTMRNIASAITGGGAKFLDRVRQKVQVELLQTYVANGKDTQLRAKYPTYAEQERHKGEAPTIEAADYAEFPTFTAYRSDLANLGRQLLEVDGTKKLGERIMKVADDVSDAYFEFAKNPHELSRLILTKRKGPDGAGEYASFKTKAAAEAAIARSGHKGKAVAMPYYKGVVHVIMSPSEAMARGIWKGDGDKRITLDPDFAGELVEKIGRVARRGAKVSVPWQFERAYDRRKQLARMGIESPAEFRAALREFIAMREQPAEADKIKAMERAMVGRRNDGLDFFPTPEGVADEMVAAADIQPGMRVLEPSAGMGHIAERIRATEVDPDVVEFSNDRRELLEAKGFNVVARDFMDLTEGGYDRILMNPPFSDGRDIQHVRHAYDLLKPGGRLVAIMGESAFFNQNKRATEFREWLESVGGTDEKLPEGTFNDPSLPVTTGANARMVVIEKPAGETGPRSIIDGPGADAQFSRAEPGRPGVPMADAKAVVATIREALPTAPEIVLHDSVRRAPENLRRLIRQAGADNDVEAVYHDGEIHVFPGNIASIERMQFVVAHHEIRHHGLRSMLGDAMGPAMLRLYASNANLRAAADAKKAAGLAETRILSVEEALADMPVEDLQKLTGWERVVAAIRQWLRQVAARLRRADLTTLADAIEPEGWTDADVAALVKRAENVSRGGAAPFRAGGTVFERQPGVRAALDKALATREAFDAYDRKAVQVEDADKFFALSEKATEARDALAAKLLAQPDDEFALQGRTSRGRMVIVNASAQNPGQWQLTRFDGNDEPWGDSQYSTKESALADFLREIDLATLQDMEGTFSRADQTQTPASNEIRFSRSAGTAKTTAPDWITSGSAALQGAAGKIDTYAPQKTMAEKAREMSAGWKQKMVQGMFDAYAPLKALSMDAYIAARMTKAADGAFEGMLMYGKPVMGADGGITGDLDGKGFLGAMRELGGEHDRFFMWLAGNRAERLLSEGKENLFNADEIAAMKALNRGAMEDGRPRVAAFKRALDEFNAYSKSVLDVAEKAGLIDGESRKLWEHDFYVPFYRMSQENEIAGPTKIKGLVRQKAFERLKGGKENLGDLMDNTLRNWSHLLSASLANVAASKSLLAAEQAGIAIEAKEAQAKEMAKAAGLKGNATYFMDQGLQRWFVVEDPAVLQAISAMEAPALNGLPLQLMAKFKKYLTVGVTIAPAFKVRNLIRDTLAAPAANEMSFNVAKNLAQGWGATNTKTDGYAQMLFGGGLMRFGTYLEGDRAEHVKRLIAEGVDDKTILNTPQKVKAMLGKAWDAWQDFGDRLENVNRTALYQQLLDKGLTPREAAYQARDMMDFSLQGSWAATRTLTAVVPFLNARMQGLYKMGRAAADNPKRMGYMVGAVALASITLMLAYQDDDDWKAREDWDRDAWWWFKIGETAYRIPKPFEVGAMGTIAERSLELVINDEMTGKRFAERMKQMVTGTFAINPVPQMFKPMLDLYANTDSFTGRQIETLGMERLSKPERYGPNTSALAKALGAAGDYTGVSPVQVDHMIRAYFGWLGTMGAATVDAATSPFSDIEKPTKKVDDYFGGFVKELPAASSRYLEDFYKQAKETSEAMADLRRAREVGDTEAAAEIMEERGDKVAQYRVYQQAQRQLADLNKRIRIVRGSTELDADTKRLRLDELTELRNRIARQVNDRMRAREAVLQ